MLSNLRCWAGSKGRASLALSRSTILSETLRAHHSHQYRLVTNCSTSGEFSSWSRLNLFGTWTTL